MIKKILILIILPLIGGVVIYALFRTNNLAVYSWFPILKTIRNIFNLSPNSLNFLHPIIKNYIVFSLPDGLWAYTFTCFMILIWRNSKSKLKYLWMYIGGIMGICQKVGQGLGIFRGTFDINDIATYILAMIFAYLITKKYFMEVKN